MKILPVIVMLCGVLVWLPVNVHAQPMLTEVERDGKKITLAEDGMPAPREVPGPMPPERFDALKRLFEHENKTLANEAICKFVNTQIRRADGHSLRFIKTFVRLIDGQPEPSLAQDSTYFCALKALTETITTHGIYREGDSYQQVHFGDLGSEQFINEALIPRYVDILENPEHPLYNDAFYVIITIGTQAADAVMPLMLEKLERIQQEGYTYDNMAEAKNIVRVLNTMGPKAQAAIPDLIRILMDLGEVDYSGDYGYDGKRGFNTEIIAALVQIGGNSETYAPLILKAIDRMMAFDEKFWENRIKPKNLNGSTEHSLTMEQSRELLLELMGVSATDMF